VPEPVWELLEVLLAGAANIAGIVFEIVGSWYEDLGRDGLLAELGRMREAWQRYGAGVAVAR
jgi:hypothetical protein